MNPPDAGPAPPDPDRDLAPIYAAFGAAVHDTQVLEFGLLLLMALATRYEDAEFSFPAPGEALAPGSAGRTLGELFRAVKDKEYLDADQRRLLRRAIRRRNELIHGFMVERVEQFLTPEGRDALRTELQRTRQLLGSANGVVTGLVDRYLAEYGTSVEELKSRPADLLPGDMDEEEEGAG
jgi:hypothetical protein